MADHPAAMVAARGGRVLLTTGRSTLGALSLLVAPFVLVRLVEPADVALPAGWSTVISRGPTRWPVR